MRTSPKSIARMSLNNTISLYCRSERAGERVLFLEQTIVKKLEIPSLFVSRIKTRLLTLLLKIILKVIMGGRRKNPHPKRAENARTVLKEEKEEPKVLCLKIPPPVVDT